MVNFNNLLFLTLHFIANLLIMRTLLTSFIILNFKLSSKLNIYFGNFVNFVYLGTSLILNYLAN